MKIFWIYLIVFAALALFLPISKEFEDDQDYSECKDEENP